jgi:hypothetical protein
VVGPILPGEYTFDPGYDAVVKGEVNMDREQLRTWLLTNIQSMLNGFLWWKPSGQQKAVLIAEYNLYLNDQGAVLDQLVKLLPPGPYTDRFDDLVAKLLEQAPSGQACAREDCGHPQNKHHDDGVGPCFYFSDGVRCECPAFVPPSGV